MNYILNKHSWNQPCMYFEIDVLMDVIEKCLEPPIKRTKYTIKKKDDKKPDIKLHDIVRVDKLGSPYYGQMGVVVMVNHRSLTPYLVKVGDAHIAYMARHLEPVNLNERKISQVVVDDLFSQQQFTIKMVRSGINYPIICHYDDREFMLEEIERMVVDPQVEEIVIQINGDVR